MAMRPSSHGYRYRQPLLALALLLAGVTLFHSIIWMRAVRWHRSALVGFASIDFLVHDDALLIEKVVPGGPADHAGLEDGDLLVAVDGVPFTDMEVLHDGISNRPPGTIVTLTVRRPGQAVTRDLPVLLDAWPRAAQSVGQRLVDELIGSYPLFFFVVGFAVLFLRLGHRQAWLLALLFVSIIAGGPLIENLGGVPRALRGFALAFRFTFGSISGSLFYFFLAVFPVSSPLDRRAPWLKWTLLAFQLAIGVPLAASMLAAGSSRPLDIAGELFENQLRWLGRPITFVGFGCYGLGIVSLVLNTLRAPTAEVRRRTRVILWGLALGPIPFLAIQLWAIVHDESFYDLPYWFWAPSVLFILLMPAAVAYAVVKHRVLEIPVLLQRSARYFLVQRGFMALLVATGGMIVVVAATLLTRALGPAADPARASRVAVPLGAAVAGALVVWLLGRVHARIASRIDRAFFRRAYDARQILEDLIARSRSARGRQELVDLLLKHLDEALQPVSLAVYLRTGDRLTLAAERPVPPPVARLPAALNVDAPGVSALAQLGRPWDTADDTPADVYAAAADLRAGAECLVPVLDRDGGVLGLLALGPRRSEEPYSGEDRRLLAGIAGQIGLSLESFALAEDIARRIEAERRVAREMEIARQVQSNLLPRRTPAVRSLDVAAHCVQARAVGGDFYDYLPLGDGHVGLVLADISGKGISAALLMSNLQASLHGRMDEIRRDPTAVLRDINRRLFDSTDSGQFATLFLGDYDDASGGLRYANCGHNPPLLLRAGGQLDHLAATATVLGAFADWTCTTTEIVLSPGDLLVVYSDGVTETGAADGEDGEMFGETRLGEIVRASRDAPAVEVVQSILAAVARYGGGGATDDLTLLVARAHRGSTGTPRRGRQVT